MSRKCAIYLRVSTDIQDYERQKEDLTKFAQNNSLTISAEDIYEDKLSGLKNQNNRIGLDTMLSNLVDNKIEAILVWEISRLSRSQTALLEIKDKLKKISVNIYFYQQRFWLLDEDTLKANPFADLLISMFGWNAEYESRLTKERFHSAKKNNTLHGKYIGGKIAFGYTIKRFGKSDNDTDKKFIINDKIIAGLNVSEADIIKETFDLYEKGDTCSKIRRLFKSKGYPKSVCNTHQLARILRNTTYVGYKETKLGRRPTPPIIDEAQFEIVGNKVETNKTKADKGRKHVYLLRGILKCTRCGKYYIGKQTDDAYQCPANSSSSKINNNTSCKGGNISTSNLDGIIWERIKDIWIGMKLHGFDEIYEAKRKDDDEYLIQIKNYDGVILELDKKRIKTNRIYQNDGYSDEEYDKELSEIKNDINSYNKIIKELNVKIRNNKQQIQNSTKLSNRKKSIDSISDRYQMQELIKSLVKNVTFNKVSLFKTVLHVLYNGGQSETILYNSVAKKGNKIKIFNSHCLTLRYDSTFYLLKPKYYPLYDGSLTLQEVASLKLKIDKFEFLNNSNSDIKDFYCLMNHSDIPNIISTRNYTKITYFKKLNKARFSRRKKLSPKKGKA